MRAIGLILVLVGALIIAYQGFTYVSRDTIVDAGPVQVTANRVNTVWIPPVVGGVAVVSGLLLLVSDRRRPPA